MGVLGAWRRTAAPPSLPPSLAQNYFFSKRPPAPRWRWLLSGLILGFSPFPINNGQAWTESSWVPRNVVRPVAQIGVVSLNPEANCSSLVMHACAVGHIMCRHCRVASGGKIEGVCDTRGALMVSDGRTRATSSSSASMQMCRA